MTELLPYAPQNRDLELQRLLKGLATLQSQPDLGITDVFFPSEKRAQTEQCKAAIKREIDGLMERGVFKRVKKKDVPPSSSVLRTRMVLTVKDVGTENETIKPVSLPTDIRIPTKTTGCTTHLLSVPFHFVSS